jgi:hypothetical protein
VERADYARFFETPLAEFLRAFADAEHCGAYLLFSAAFPGVESSFTDDPVMIWLGQGYVHDYKLEEKVLRLSVGSRGALVRLVVPYGAVVGFGIHEEKGDPLLVRRSAPAPVVPEEPTPPKARRGLRAV